MTHFNGQVYIQRVEEAHPAELDQYGKVRKPAVERSSIQVLEVKVVGESWLQVHDALKTHLEAEHQLKFSSGVE